MKKFAYIFSLTLVLLGSMNAFALAMPYAVLGKRIKSWSDMQDPIGQKHSNAAFANYINTATHIHRF